MIQKMEVHPVSLRFKSGFSISRGKIGEAGALAPHVLVMLGEENGELGWGESRSSHLWSYETNETVLSTLEQYLRPCVIGQEPGEIEELHRRMDSVIAPGITRGQPIAKSSLDISCHDLVCRQQGVPISSFLGGSGRPEVELTYLISATSEGEAEEMTRSALKDGYRGFKIKIGRGIESDLGIIEACSRAAGNRFLWADANQAYSFREARELARGAGKLDLQVLEQPMISTARRDIVRLSEESPVPIAIDESVFTPEDLEDFISWGFRGPVVIKVAKSGGLHPARRMIEIAMRSGLDLLGSGLTESMVGFSASIQLFHAMGIDHPVDLNGPQFIEDHISTGPVVEGGRGMVSGPGLGVRVDIDRNGAKDGGKVP